jgi:hypothetical protein
MRTSYGVVWRTGAEPLARGKLELLPRVLRLDGTCHGGPVALELPYAELDAVRTGRTARERLSGRPTLVLERRGRAPIVIASVAQAGVVAELTEHLAKQLLG